MFAPVTTKVAPIVYEGTSAGYGWAERMEAGISGWKFKNFDKVNQETFKGVVKAPFTAIKIGEGFLAGFSKAFVKIQS